MVILDDEEYDKVWDIVYDRFILFPRLNSDCLINFELHTILLRN